MTELAYLIGALAAVQEGDGTLLDHCALLATSDSLVRQIALGRRLPDPHRRHGRRHAQAGHPLPLAGEREHQQGRAHAGARHGPDARILRRWPGARELEPLGDRGLTDATLPSPSGPWPSASRDAAPPRPTPTRCPSARFEGEPRSAIITALSFTRESPKGVTPGFDLDGVASTDDKESCRQPDTVDPEGNLGIDNQVARLVPTVELVYGNAIDGLVQGAINNGELEIMLDLAGAGDQRSADCVNLGVLVGKGAVALGTNGVIEGFQTFERDEKSPLSTFQGATIADGLLEAGPFDMAVPIAIFDVSFMLHFHGAHFRARIDEEGVHGRDLRWRRSTCRSCSTA